MVEDVVGQLKCSISDNQFIFGGVLLHFSMVKNFLINNSEYSEEGDLSFWRGLCCSVKIMIHKYFERRNLLLSTGCRRTILPSELVKPPEC